MQQVNNTYPAGKYYVGDICNALDIKVYKGQWGGKYSFAVGTHDFKSNGVTEKISVNYTAYGDGTYTDDVNGFKFDVDSGTIGIVPIALCNNQQKIPGGHIIESSTSVVFNSDKGVFVIGYNNNNNMIIIDTDDADEADFTDDSELSILSADSFDFKISF
jgi:hypothetical protein